MWWEQIIKLGVMQPTPKAPSPKAAIPAREQPGEAVALQITIRRAERFKQVTKLQKFNYETMTVEPVDLTGYQARMTIRADQENEQS
jgi:hypothetical protein